MLELLYVGLFWTILIGALVTIVLVGVLAGGVAHNRLESVAIDMSPDQDSLSTAKKPYQPLNIKSVLKACSWFGYRGKVQADEPPLQILASGQ